VSPSPDVAEHRAHLSHISHTVRTCHSKLSCLQVINFRASMWCTFGHVIPQFGSFGVLVVQMRHREGLASSPPPQDMGVVHPPNPHETHPPNPHETHALNPHETRSGWCSGICWLSSSRGGATPAGCATNSPRRRRAQTL